MQEALRTTQVQRIHVEREIWLMVPQEWGESALSKERLLVCTGKGK